MLNKNFFTFFLIQFLGAFNDNVYKNVLVLLIVFQGISLAGMNSQILVSFAFGIFILPFFIFSSLAGQLADKYPKNRLVVYLKILELFIMLFAVMALSWQQYELLLLLLFLMGTQSAFFGPVKYSIIPELALSAKIMRKTASMQLLIANGWIEMGTFIAILLGTIIAGFLVTDGQSLLLMASIVLIGISSLGLILSFQLPTIVAKDKNLRINYHWLKYSVQLFKAVKASESIFHVILLISLFWFLGACILSQMPNWGKQYLLADEREVSILLFAFTSGIGIGSMVCRALTRFYKASRLTVLGTIGLILNLLIFVVASKYYLEFSQNAANQISLEFIYMVVILSLFLMGIFSGLYIVPLYTFIQVNVAAEILSRNIALTNILNALFMVGSAILIMILQVFSIALLNIFLLICLIFTFYFVNIFLKNKKAPLISRFF